MTRTRDEHLAWCRSRALAVLEAGDRLDAIASMISDLRKWERPLYDEKLIQLLWLDAVFFRETPAQTRTWIEGFA